MDRTRDVTLIVPDAAVRVLLLDFDALPSKAGGGAAGGAVSAEEAAAV